MGNCRHGKLDGCSVCEEIEQLHVQLAGCGVAAMSNTRESLARAKEVKPGTYGFSASYSDVLRCVEREIQEREAKELAERDTERLDWLFAELNSPTIMKKIAAIANAYAMGGVGRILQGKQPIGMSDFRSAIDEARGK